MLQVFVIRLLSSDGTLLAWARVPAEAQSDGVTCRFVATAATELVIERNGFIATLAIHWPDLNLALAVPWSVPQPVAAGQQVTLSWAEPVWTLHGMPNIPLPMVTERQPVVIAVPTGAMGVRGTSG